MDKKKETIMSFGLLFVGFIWGMGFIAVNYTIESGMSPIATNFVRFFLASLMTVIIFPKQVLGITKNDIKYGFLPSIAMALSFYLQNTAMKYTTPGNASLITGSYIILVPLLLIFFTRALPNKRQFLAAFITFGGIVILCLPSFNPENFQIGDLMTFGSAIGFALHFILLERALKKVDAGKMTFIQMATVALIFLIMLLIFDLKNIQHINVGKAILPILFLGIFSSFLAYCLQTYCQKAINPTKVAILMSSESIFGAGMSVILGIEPLTAYLLIGGSIAFSGMILAQIPQKKKD